MDPAGQTICLCMIVKNEAPVIRRCLDSVKGVIDSWVIVDTGSTDGTQEIIRDHMRNVPGTLYERPWKDFAHNRSEALSLCRSQGDYALIIDADDVLEVPAGFRMPALVQDSYLFDIADHPLRYQRKQMVSNRQPWLYRGVLHEFLACGEVHSTGVMPLVMQRNHDGARRRDPQTYVRDAAVLEKALEREADPYLRNRYSFYLAQSYRDCGQAENALRCYLKRAELGGWEEEVYVSLYQAARIKENLAFPDAEVLEAYEAAARVSAKRAEALHGASRFCRVRRRYAEGYDYAKRALGRAEPPDALFSESWIYQVGLLDEFAVNASWIGRYGEAHEACVKILETGLMQGADLQRVTNNVRLCFRQAKDITREAGAPASLERGAAK